MAIGERSKAKIAGAQRCSYGKKLSGRKEVRRI